MNDARNAQSYNGRPYSSDSGATSGIWRSGVSAERRHLKKADKFAAVCRRAATEQENRPPSP